MCDLSNLDNKQLDQKLLNSNDQDEIDKIISIFNLNLKKRELIRTNMLSQLQDGIAQQMEKRVLANSDCFSNKDLLEYFRIVQQVLDKQNQDGTPTIQIQQNNITLESNELNKESRDRIKEVVQKILNSKNNDEDIIDAEYINIENNQGDDSIG